MRRRRSEEQLAGIGNLLRMLLTTREIATVRRAMRGATPKEMKAIWRGREKSVQEWWLSEHPGRTAAEYRLLRDDESEIWKWRRAKGREYFCRGIESARRRPQRRTTKR
jgi:hypothetical protein